MVVSLVLVGLALMRVSGVWRLSRVMVESICFGGTMAACKLGSLSRGHWWTQQQGLLAISKQCGCATGREVQLRFVFGRAGRVFAMVFLVCVCVCVSPAIFFSSCRSLL